MPLRCPPSSRRSRCEPNRRLRRPRPRPKNAPAAQKPVLSAKAAAARIDAALAEAWKKDGVKANAPVSDETWVRRVYLDAIGRIPTADEIEAFVADKAPDKRSVLIDRLLDSEGYVSHFYNFWADLLRVNTETVPGGGRLSQEMYARWIRQCLRENKPYDQFVRELLTTQGPIWKSGAPGYYLRDPGMPLDNLSNTVQVFLGTRIVCAQCHDHPFDKWKQLDYYKLAAFTYGVESAGANNSSIAPANGCAPRAGRKCWRKRRICPRARHRRRRKRPARRSSKSAVRSTRK